MPRKTLLSCKNFGGFIHRIAFLGRWQSGLVHAPNQKDCVASLRSFSSQQHLVQIRGTIPSLGHGVAVGQHAEVERRFSATQIELFGDLVQDKNILHSPPDNWEETVLEMPHLLAVQDAGLIRFNEREGCIYMNQTLHFGNPVFAEELVLARIDIEKIRRWKHGGVVVQCQTKASVGYDENTGTFSKDAVTGVANVWLPSGYQVSTE